MSGGGKQDSQTTYHPSNLSSPSEIKLLRTLRGLQLQDDDSHGFPSPPPRSGVCLVLDAGKVERLASLTFIDSDPKRNMRALEQCKLLAVDIHWKRPAMTKTEYRGCRELEIGMLDSVYSDLDLLTLPDVEQWICSNTPNQLLSVTIIYTIRDWPATCTESFPSSPGTSL